MIYNNNNNRCEDALEREKWYELIIECIKRSALSFATRGIGMKRRSQQKKKSTFIGV